MTRLPPVVWGVVGSRLLLLISGVMGAALFGRIPQWQILDPTRISSSLGPVGNALAAASVRWDSIHYLSIAQHGYKPAGDTGFFPLYPLLMHGVSWLVGSYVIAGALISVVSFGIALTLLHRLTCKELGTEDADATVLLLAFAPLSLFFTAIYTESLFLALSVGTFYLARQNRLVLACVVAGCAALTHVEGVVLAAPLAYMYWEDHGRSVSPRQLVSWGAAALLLPLLALLALFFYMHEIGYGWLAPITGVSVTGHGYSIAPILPAHSSIFVRSVVGPIITIWRAGVAGVSGLWQTVDGTARPIAPSLGDLYSVGFQNVVYLVVLLISLAALVETWRRLPKPYAIYATLVLILFTSSVVTIIPLRAFDRYMLPLFPLWMSAAAWLRERHRVSIMVHFSAVLMVFYTVEFARWSAVA